MKKLNQSSTPSCLRSTVRNLMLSLVALPAAVAFAAQTDISSTPMANTTAALVKPNIMLLMDTSGSMGWGHMPDEVETVTGFNSIGYKSAQCNVLYYNPKQKYEVPKKPDLSSFPTPSFSSAPYAGFVSYYVSPDAKDLSSVNLANAFKAYDDKTLRTSGFNDVPQAAYYYEHSSGVAMPYASPACQVNDTGATTTSDGSGGTWTRKLLTSASEQENFAKWYSFYRIRISLIKSAASLAFTPLSDNYRVGFITVQPKESPDAVTINTDKYVAINDFNSTQRGLWFNKLFSQSPGGASPAREGLARVGRHFAGKQDGINAGMTGDPVQYSCQQNFTIMTTDGYWNAQTEASNGGPIGLDGLRVKQQDAPLTDFTTDPDGTAPRPIFDGSSDSTKINIKKSIAYDYVDCGTFYNVSTVQYRRSTSQLTASTSQLQQSTARTDVTTAVTSQSTAQTLRNTSQLTASTSQVLQSTSQLSRSTSQINRSTTQVQQINTQLTRSTSQLNIATSIIKRSTSQLRRSTSQLTQSTLQTRIATSQLVKATSQLTRSTSVLNRSTSQLNIATSQVKKSTTQNLATQTRKTQSTTQTIKCDASTELCAPAPPSGPGSCVAGGLITCQTVNTGPTLVASCTPASASAANSYVTTTCDTTVTGPTGVASCSPSGATSANGYTATTCSTADTGPTAIGSCTAAGPTAANSYVTTTCATTNTGPTPTGSCAAAGPTAGNGYLTTTCPIITTGPTAVDTCTAQTAGAGNSYLAITCATATTGPTGVASCAASGPTSGNGWTTTTCNTVTTGPAGAASCTAAVAGSSNSYTTTTCSTATTGPTPISNCTPIAASAANSYLATTCPNVTTGPTGVSSCTPVSAGGGNSYTATTCNTVTTGPTGVPSCTVSGPTSGNSYVDTTCATVTTGPTAVASCTVAGATAGNSYTDTTCATTTTGPTPTGACTAAGATAGNGFTTTTCPVVTTGPTNVGTCTPAAATVGNNWTATICNTVNGAATGVATCTPVAPNGSGAGVICNTATTGPTPVAACTPSGPTAGNGYTTTTCNTVTTGPTLVATCTPATAAAGNTFTTTTCANAITGPTPVATCTAAVAAAGNSFVTTTCTPVNGGPTGVTACAPIAAAAGNAYTTTTCNTVTTPQAGVATCTGAAPSAANFYTATICTPNNVGPTPVASCAPSGPTAGNGYTTTTCNTVTAPAAPAAACTPSGPTAGNGYTTTSCNTVTTPAVGVATCTPLAASAGNGWTATLCSTAVSGPTGVSSCTSAAPGSGNGYLGTTCNVVAGGPTLVASCLASTASAANSWTETTCNATTTGPIVAATCTAAAASSANNFVTTTCTSIPGKKIVSQITSNTTSYEYSGPFLISTSPTVTTFGAKIDYNGVCYMPGTELALPTAPPVGDSCFDAAGCTTTTPHGGGSENSLADVAQYYYKTPLRTGPAWPSDKDNPEAVQPVGNGAEDDRATWQHMTTFTVGLGVSGTLDYRSDYRNASAVTGHFAEIRTGARNWPLWPNPLLDYSTGEAWNNAKSIDDFWHAAVNGRGQYFSAGDPTSVITGLRDALFNIGGRTGSASGAGTSSPLPVPGDNFAFVASYKTQAWWGDVRSGTINLSTGAVSETGGWSAQALLDLAVGNACDNRKIYLLRLGAPDNKVNFSWNSLACDASGLPTGSPDTGLNAAEQAYFGVLNQSLLTQYPSMTDGTPPLVDQRTPGRDANLVNFLRGQRGLEGFVANDVKKLFRTREHVLGDIVSGKPVYVKAPFASYQDAGYEAYKTANAARTPMIYVPANDGMLHAFFAGSSVGDPTGGKEAWAMIPTSVLPNLYKLADANYKNLHQFSVDGTPTVADIYDAGAGAWKTILVGGLNYGGKAYYAIDVTDPLAPKGMWEFKWSNTCYDGSAGTASADCHIGYTYGRPVISKLSDGTWVVMVTSGYNNVNATAKAGDGEGYLYVLNAATGKIIHKLATGAGSAATPSGLAQINNFVDNVVVNNTTLQVYGGDLLGNIWRFDINDTLGGPGRDAALIGTATDKASGTPQPISVRPELAELNGKPMVFVGTGRFLGATDIGDSQGQSIYGIVDPRTAGPVYANLRAALAPLTLSPTPAAANAIRTVTCTASLAECGSASGWVADLPDTGERVNIEMQLQLGTLFVGSNVPTGTACSPNGYSWLNQFDFATGRAVSSSAGSAVSTYLTGSMLSGINLVKLPDGGTGSPYKVLERFTNDKTGTGRAEIGGAVATGKRISWREIAE
jgi:Tfp pilus tip-associated adhesin PilY1